MKNFASFLIITVVSAFCNINLSAQTTFRLSYDVANFDIAGGMVENPAGEFVFTGLNSTFIPFFGNTIKVDNAGNIVWAKSYTGGIATNFSDIKNVSGGGYIITGSSSNGGAVLVRIDDNGAVVWAKRYQLPNLSSGNTSNEYGNSVIQTSDGGFLVGGGVDYFWDGVSASTVDTASALGFKVDGNGNLLWSKVWTIPTANPDEHYINDVAESADGYFFVGQSSEGSGTLSSNGDYPSNALVIKTTTAGALTYIRRWGAGDTKFQNINSALRLANGNILLGGNDDYHSFLVTLTGTGSTPTTTGLNRRINGAAFPPRTLIIQDIMENADGNYSVIGMQIEPLSFAFYTAIYKVNSSTGAIIFGRGYTPIGLSSILPEGGLAADQGYYMVMTDQQSTGFNYNIIRTDATGQLGVPAGCGSTSLNPSTTSYGPTFTTPTFSEYNLAVESTFTPVVNNLTPTKVTHCQVIACAPPAAATTVTASSSPICAGQSSTITASGPATGVTYEVFAAATGGASMGTTPLAVTPGTTTTYYIETVLTANPACVSTTRTPVTVTVTQLPTATASSNSTCVGGTLSLTSGGGGTYSWSGPNGFSSSSQNPSIGSVSAAASGTYTVTVTASGCSATSTVSVTVSAGLTAVVGSNEPVCNGSALNLTSSGGTTYSWSGPNGYTSSSQNPTIGSATSTAAGTYTVTVTSGTCSATGTVAVSITPLPTATAGGNNPVCQGSALNLTASGGTSYSWVGPQGATSNTQNPTIGSVGLSDAGIYTVTVTASNCTSTSTVNISVTPAPVATASSNTTCVGGTLTLTSGGGGTYSWTGPNGFTSSSQNPSIGSVTAAASGTYTVTVTASGCSATSTVSVTISAGLTAIVNSNGPVCSGSALNLTSSGGTTYSWSGPNGYTSSSQNPTIGSATSTAAGTYTVTVTSGTCSATGTVAVSITPLPTATAGGNNPVCEGSTINLTSSGGTTYSWSGPNGYTSNSQNPSIGTVTPAAGGTYTVSVTASGCTATSTTSITITPAPAATASANSGTACEGSAINLTSSGGTTYSWSGPNGYTSSTQNPTIPGATPSAAGTYTVTVTSSGCSSSSTVTLAVTNAPVAAAGGASFVCVGSSLNLTASGGTGYSWSGPNGFTGSTQNPSISGVTLAGSGTYTVTVTASSGCTATSAVAVSVLNAPTAAITGSSSVCQGSAVTLTASGGGTYSWSNGTTAASVSVNPSSPTLYWVIVSVGSCTDSAGINITVDPIPTITAAGNGPVCDGAAVNLTASGGSTYSWTGPNGYTSGSQNPTITPATPVASGTYTVTVTGSNSCTATSAVTITVNPLPTIAISGTTTICNGNATTLTASGATTYSWNTGATSATISVSPTAGTSYTVTGTDANGCSSTQTNTVNVTTPPVASITGNSPICEGQSLTLTAGGSGPYLWSNGQTTQSITVNPVTTTPYSVIVGTGCTDTADVSVTVNPLPTLTTSGDVTIIKGTSTTLIAGGGTTYTWTPSTNLSCDTCAISVATPTVTTTYCVETSSASECVKNACLTVEVDILCGEIFVPKAFSPNGDGENEVEYVMGNCINNLEFAIFDRWGEKVFETTDITIGWDGTYKGKKLDAAVFVYYLKATVKGVEVNMHGNITLVK